MGEASTITGNWDWPHLTHFVVKISLCSVCFWLPGSWGTWTGLLGATNKGKAWSTTAERVQRLLSVKYCSYFWMHFFLS